MNLLVASIYLLLLLNTCNHAFGQLLDCDCAPLRYTFDVFYQRGCDTVSLSGFSNDAIDETGVTCSVTGLWSPGGIYAYNATILNVRSTDANRYEITNSPFDPAADSFQISFLGPFGGDNGAPIMKDNYSSGLDIELNIFRSLQDYILIRRMEVFIPYTGLCDQIVFSDGDELAWLTFNGTESIGPLDETCTSSQAPSLVPSAAPTTNSLCNGKGKGLSTNGCAKSEKKMNKSAKSMKSVKSAKSAGSVKSVKSAKSAGSVKSVKSAKSAGSVKSVKSAKSAGSVKGAKSKGSNPKSTKIASAKGKGARRYTPFNKRNL